MKKLLLLSFGTLALAISSCKNDLDVTDDYRETMVVYGLLNPTDTAQYIKINKAFLGRESAYNMAAVYDSSNYAPGVIDAVLQQWKNGNLMATFQLTPDSVIPKDAGVFSNPKQVLYKTTAPILQDGSDYVLKIINGESGKTVTASTPIIQPISVQVPLPSSNINLVGQTTFKAKWTTAVNGRLYNLVVRFKYQERFVYDTLQVADKYVDIGFVNVRANTLSGGDQLVQDLLKDNFFRTIKNSPGMDTSLLKERFFKSLEFRFSAAAEDFATYMDVASTTGSTFGDHPFFSNIVGDNTVGLFSSRFTYVVPNVGLNNITLDTLRYGQFTYNLRFQ